jgi:hypothetical protein
MPFLQRFTSRSSTTTPNRALDLPVADCVAAENQGREVSDSAILADAKVCTPNNGRSKEDNDEEDSIVKAVCLSSLIAEEKYDVEGQIYLSSISVEDDTIILESSTPHHQEV